jgi:hypothetical protein
MTVQITPKSTQHTGMATSTEGSVAAWQVTFELQHVPTAVNRDSQDTLEVRV